MPEIPWPAPVASLRWATPVPRYLRLLPPSVLAWPSLLPPNPILLYRHLLGCNLPVFALHTLTTHTSVDTHFPIFLSNTILFVSFVVLSTPSSDPSTSSRHSIPTWRVVTLCYIPLEYRPTLLLVRLSQQHFSVHFDSDSPTNWLPINHRIPTSADCIDRSST